MPSSAGPRSAWKSILAELMARRRFAVAVMIPAPASIEVDALRSALGDRQLGRIGPHVTIVPPINLHADDLGDAMVVVERAAAQVDAFRLRLGPIETFSQDSATRFLRVDPWAPLVELYRACWTGPFDRPEKRSFHPHVTIDIDGSPTGGPDPALDLLGGFATETGVDRLTLLEHRADEDRDDPSGRRWEPFAHHPLRGVSRNLAG